MNLRIYYRKDFWSGMMFTGFGAVFAILSRSYDMGTLGEMGPGWFPLVLGLLQTALGILITVGASMAGKPVSDGDGAIEPIGWKELSLVLLAIALFALSLASLGVILSVMVMVGVASFAAHERRLLEMAAVAIVLCALCYAVFVRGLGVPLPVWPVLPGV